MDNQTNLTKSTKSSTTALAVRKIDYPLVRAKTELILMGKENVTMVGIENLIELHDKLDSKLEQLRVQWCNIKAIKPNDNPEDKGVMIAGQLVRRMTSEQKDDALKRIEAKAQRIAEYKANLPMKPIEVRELLLGDEGERKALGAISFLLNSAQKRLNLTKLMDADQLEYLAQDIITTHGKQLTMDDVALCLRIGLQGRYGPVEYKIDQTNIHAWLSKYQAEKLKIREEKAVAKHTSSKPEARERGKLTPKNTADPVLLKQYLFNEQNQNNGKTET